VRERSAEVQRVKKELEAKQEEFKKELAAGRPEFANELDYNYRALQIFDLLSLYFCCDGYSNDDEFKEYKITPVRVSYDSDETVTLRVVPAGGNAVSFDPYPFDISPIKIAVRARIMTLESGKSETAGLEAYQKAPRQLLTFEMTR
jgi:hypothetical protein